MYEKMFKLYFSCRRTQGFGERQLQTIVSTFPKVPQPIGTSTPTRARSTPPFLYPDIAGNYYQFFIFSVL
jgi:hypothetical protein